MHDVWPVLFVSYRSKAEDALKALRDGTLSATITSGAHIRRGARFILAVEDGRILGTGEVVKAFKDKHELSVRAESPAAEKAMVLPKPQAEQLKALLGSSGRPPVAAYVIPTEGKGLALGVTWFDEVTALVEQRDAGAETKPPTSANRSVGAKPEPSPGTKAADRGPEETSDADRGLLEWLPPRLAPLVDGKARADQWEILVAAAFRALGLTTEELGQSRPGEPVPDCIARYDGKFAGSYVLVVDAKAGEWNAPVDAIRAMRDYMVEFGGHGGYPVFVVGRLGKDARHRLAEAVIGHSDLVAITGRQLAEILVKKLTHPELPFETELRQLLRSGRG